MLIVALHSGSLAIVGVLISLCPVTTIALAYLVLHERMAPFKVAGATLAVVAATVLALN